MSIIAIRVALVLLALSVLLTVYALWIREWLKAKPWAAPFFAWIEPIEIALYQKSEVILFARLKVLGGLLLAMLTNIGTIDLTPLMPFVPEKWQPYVHAVFNLMPLILSAVGWFDEQLRKKTTKPIELVAVPAASVTPEVAVAIAQADEAKEQAVATVKAAS